MAPAHVRTIALAAMLAMPILPRCTALRNATDHPNFVVFFVDDLGCDPAASARTHAGICKPGVGCCAEPRQAHVAFCIAVMVTWASLDILPHARQTPIGWRVKVVDSRIGTAGILVRREGTRARTTTKRTAARPAGNLLRYCIKAECRADHLSFRRRMPWPDQHLQLRYRATLNGLTHR